MFCAAAFLFAGIFLIHNCKHKRSRILVVADELSLYCSSKNCREDDLMGGPEVLVERLKASGGNEMETFQGCALGILCDLYDQIRRSLIRARTIKLQPFLDSLAALVQAEKVEKGRLPA